MFGSGITTVAGRAPRLAARSAAATIVLAASLTLAACSGGGAPGPGGAVAASTAPGAIASTAAAPAGCAKGEVSANIASVEDLAASFHEGGIPNADKWAQEVEEYRPYPEDPTWAKLHKELGKYNIDAALFDAILSCLTI